MTPHAAAILDLIRELGYVPSMRVIMARCNVSSTSEVSRHLKKLEQAGHIVRGNHSPVYMPTHGLLRTLEREADIMARMLGLSEAERAAIRQEAAKPWA